MTTLTPGADAPAVATSAAPFARYSSKRTRLRRFRRAQTFVVAFFVLLTGLAWSQLVRLDWNPALLVVPILVASTAVAAFIRKPWAAVLVRASLWSSFVCGAAAAIGVRNDMQDNGLIVAIPAALGLLFLGRFSRSLGGARRLVVALVALAIGDAVMHALASAFIFVDGIVRGSLHDEGPLVVFTFTAIANVVGLVCMRRLHVVWPHVVGNAIVVVLAALDVSQAKPVVNVVIGGAALLQITLALASKLPPASRGTRRAGEWALRIAIVVVTAIAIASVAG